MNKKNIQSTLFLIKKYADDTDFEAPGAPAAKPAAPTTATTPTATTTDPSEIDAPGATSAPAGTKKIVQSPVIIEMQNAIIKLATAIDTNIDYDGLTKSLSSGTGVDLASYNTDALSNFMAITYMRDSDIKGEEYDTDKKRSKVEEKRPSELKSMFGILDTIKRIGTGKSEFKPDGSWGPRTNNALQDVSALVSAIMRLGTDLGMQSRAFDVNKLSQLSELIPPDHNSISIQEKLSRAKQITPLLKGAYALYMDYKQQILSKPTYKRFIEGAPLLTISPGKEKQPQINYVNDEKAIFDNLLDYVQLPFSSFKINIPGINGEVEINALDISSKTTFEQWLKKYPQMMEITQNDPSKWQSMAQSILNKVISKATQAATAYSNAAKTKQVQQPGF